MSLVDEAKAAIAAFKAKRIAKQAKKLAKKKVIYGGQLMALGDTPQNTYIGLYTSSEEHLNHEAKMNAMQAKIDAQIANHKALQAAQQQMVSSFYVPPMLTSSAAYGYTNVHMTYGTNYSGQSYNESHGYYDAGVNNKKMVSDLEAKVAELKAELDKKKLQEEALATTDGKRVVEI